MPVHTLSSPKTPLQPPSSAGQSPAPASRARRTPSLTSVSTDSDSESEPENDKDNASIISTECNDRNTEKEDNEKPEEHVTSTTQSLSRNTFENAQLADQPRLPWAWLLSGRTNQLYTSVVRGKWWSRTSDEILAMPPNQQASFSHIGRIMETELGEELKGESRCSACQSHGEECWVYTEKGARQIYRSGDTCARCRVVARRGGCSLSKRVQQAPAKGKLARILPQKEE